jgi:capsular polysaccharide biosynthesis protein
MPGRTENRAVALSERWFRRLLVIYPKRHREEYGSSMTQLFRDQCRDAWEETGYWGVIKLWLHILPDLFRTSVLEHLSTLKEKFMSKQSFSTPTTASVAVFVIVFVVVFGAAVLGSFMLPESYASTARIKIDRDSPGDESSNAHGRRTRSYDPYFIQTEIEVIQSEIILGEVAANLNLNSVFAKRYNNGQPIRTSDGVALLRKSLALRPVRNTTIIEIKAFSEDSQEAANIANGIASTYKEHRKKLKLDWMSDVERTDPMVIITDRAVASPLPAQPRKALNFFIGAIWGALLGAGAGAGTGGIMSYRARQKAVAA